MTAFIQAVAGALIGIILCLAIRSHSRDLPLLLSLAVSVMVLLVAVNFLQPVVELIRSLEAVGQLDTQLLQAILKAVGIGLIGELAALICNDSGNSALGRAVEVLTAAAVLWLSIPLFRQLLELVQQMAGGI